MSIKLDSLRVLQKTLLVLLLALPATQGFTADEASRIKVNINTADAALLAEGLDGVGDARAQAIVEYREQHGPFKQVEELTAIKGIGASTLDANRSRIVLQ